MFFSFGSARIRLFLSFENFENVVEGIQLALRLTRGEWMKGLESLFDLQMSLTRTIERHHIRDESKRA